MKKKYINSAKIFQREAQISTKSSAMDVPGGFLYEWWSIFWATYIARYYQQGSKTQEQVDQPKLQQSPPQWWLEQMQMQHIVLQQYQQQQRDKIQLQSNTTTNSNTARQNLAVTNALARKKILQQKSNDNVNQLSNATHATLSRSTASEGQFPRQLPYDASVSNLSYFHQVKDPKQQVLTPQNMINPATCLRLPGADGSLDRIAESDQAASNFPLEGWPLSVLQQQILKNDQCHREHFQPLQSLGQQLDHPNCRYQQPDKMDAAACNKGYDAMSNTFRDYSQATENQILRKRRRDPANSLAAGNAVGMQKSTSMLSINEVGPHGDISSNTHLFCSGSFGPQTSGADQLVDSDNSGSLAHNVESFLSSSNPETKNAVSACLEASQDIAFSEVGVIHANLVNHCDFSYDGKLIATSGNDEKIILWSVDSREQKCLMEEHSAAITDIRFCPRLPKMGTSSLDKTVKIWNTNNPRHTLRSFVGHSAPVLSLDFHPKEDVICSCDDATEIRYWNINSAGCTGVSKADATQVRFQCIHGKYLAAAVRSGVSIIDVETAQTYGYPLQGHATNVNSVCWNSSGEYLASLSEDLIRVWKIGSGEMQQCVHELSISNKKFQCCLFHPSCPFSLIIGFNQSLDIWHVAENKMITVLEQPINALAVSQYSCLIASASDENLIKLWK